MTFLSTPLMKSFVGFDNLFDEFEKVASHKDHTFPSYNIEKLNETDFEITIALAGYNENEIDAELKQGLLTVSAGGSEGEQKNYIHRGIAKRAFCRQFRVAETVEVIGAELQNGILCINLHQSIPVADQAMKIEIKSSEKQVSSKISK